MTEFCPMAMFAKGPQWTSIGCPSNDCMSVGLRALTRRAHMAPSTSRSFVVTGVPRFEKARTIFERRARKSLRSLAIARMAITSEATVM